MSNETIEIKNIPSSEVTIETPEGTEETIMVPEKKPELENIENKRGKYKDQTPFSPEKFAEILAKFVDVSPGIAEYSASLRSWVRQARLAHNENTSHWYGEFEFNEVKHQAFREFLIEKMGYVEDASSPIFLAASRNLNMDIPEVILCCDIDGDTIKMFAIGDLASCLELEPITRAFFPKHQVRFADYKLVNGQVHESSVNMTSADGKQPKDSFYPWLKDAGLDLESFYQEYLRSDEAVLILMGPPGTGKTTWIRGLLNNVKSRVGMCSDSTLMAADPGYLINKLTSGQVDLMVFEDADVLISKTTTGQRNISMASILNSADGLTTNASRNIKMVFTTNIVDEDVIEDALKRDGRCFALIHFGYLDQDEAEVVVKDLGIQDYPIEESSRHSLAQISKYRNNRITFRSTRRLGLKRD